MLYDVLTPSEVRTVIESISPRSPKGKRLRAAIALLASSGVRISEALAVRPADFIADGGSVRLRIHRGKGGKARVVSVGSDAYALVREWIEYRRTMGIDNRYTLLCSYSKGSEGSLGNRSNWSRWIASAVARAGIEKRITAHRLRDTHAIALSEAGVPVARIARQLGHASVATTDGYLRKRGYEAPETSAIDAAFAHTSGPTSNEGNESSDRA